MKNIILAVLVAFAFSTAAMAGDIAISTQAGWFGQAAADREMQEIADNVTAVPVEQFTADDQAALADWVVAHTGNGVSDLLIVCGQLPDTIYPAGNAQPDGSIAELFLDDGNIIVNTGDWIFYVVNSSGANGPGGLQNMMDIPGVTVAGEDNTAVAITAEGLDITPSLVDFQTDRPFHLDTLEGAWYPELILAQNGAGTRADPVIVSNAETGGRIGIFYQTAGQDDDPRGEVIGEWINNWYLTAGDVPNPPASNPNPADGAIDADVASLEWAAAFGAATYKVYLSTDATIDDADLIGETNLELQVVTLDPGASYYWRVDAVDADGVAIEGPLWSLSTLPLEAHFPVAADGATNAISVELSWTPGKDAIMHNVNYGTDPAALMPVSMMQMGTTYDPGALDADTTYYWRVDEFTPAGTVPGPVWSFSTIGAVPPSGTPDLIAQFEFDEDASTLAALDTSGNDHHGPLLGDASIAGGVLSLDGNGDAVDAGRDPAFHPAGSFSISAFVNMNSWGGSWGNAIAGTRGEGGLGWQLRRHSGNQNLTFTLRGTSGADDPQGSISPPLNEWIHVAA
ncbi:MAG: LamG-like jellyroll fold domain-containing protein, partial [Planctomycetota bacterium]